MKPCNQATAGYFYTFLNKSLHALQALPSRSIMIKPRQLLPRILYILLRLHPHIEYRTIPTLADNLTMQTPLTPLTLRPQASETHFQSADFV